MAIHHVSPQISLTKLFNLEHALWDFDGVFYAYDEVKGGFYRLFDESGSATAKKLLGIEKAQALQMAREGGKKYNDGITIFVKYAEEQKLDAEEIKTSFHRMWHIKLLELVKSQHPEVLDPNPNTVEAFKSSLKLGVSHGIVTHGAKMEWCIPVLDSKGLLPYFQQNAILGYEDYDFNSKRQNTVGIETCMDIIGAHKNGSTTAFVEDSVSHLQLAKSKFPDLLTVWVNASYTKDSNANDNIPDGVDIIVNTPYDFVNAINEQKTTAAQLQYA